MCELFCLSSRLPATVTLSMDEFARHGGLTGPHGDGWGIAFFDGGDVRIIREPEAAADSEWLSFVRNHHIRSTAVISHIRQATQGGLTLKNTHPFARELGGRMHVFAHNGTLAGFERLALGAYRPIGDTDSEHAFCHLLHNMTALWQMDPRPPTVETRISAVADFAATLRGLGAANFIYSDGDLLFVHGHKRIGTDGNLLPPGLHLLCRQCVPETGSLEAAGIGISHNEQEVVLAASVPLTDEGWIPLEEGELAVLSEGRIIERRAP